MKTNKQKPMRQGDVLILPVKKIPSNLVRTKQVTLALGEATGHHHTIYGGAVGYANTETELSEYFEVTDATADLTHQEHTRISIPNGKYRKVIQSEYIEQDNRKVVD